jgi:AbrB family looped-hinge helix DNA binding protein
MEMVEITEAGQITLPPAMRERLGLKGGDRMALVETGRELKLVPPFVAALRDFQDAMAGEAERAGIADEEEVARLCREARRELGPGRHASNA